MLKGAVGRMAVNLVIVVMIVVFYVAVNKPASLQTFGSSIHYRGESSTSHVALQCVVSWDTEIIRELLSILDSEDVKITFFVDGEWVAAQPELANAIIDYGHELGMLGDNGSVDAIAKSIIETREQIMSICGREPTLYYCEGIAASKAKKAAKLAQGVVCVSCTYDLLCGRGSSADIVKRAKKALFGGSIITVTPTEALSDALLGIIGQCRDAGLSIVRTGELIGRSNG